MPGVQEVIKVSKPYKARQPRHQSRTIPSFDFPATAATIGGPGLGDCRLALRIESRDQAFAVARSASVAPRRSSSAGALTNLARHPTLFKDWKKKACASWLKSPASWMKIITEAIDRECSIWSKSMRIDPDRRAQYAEFFVAKACGTRPPSRSAEARHVGNSGRFLDGCGIIFERR